MGAGVASQVSHTITGASNSVLSAPASRQQASSSLGGRKVLGSRPPALQGLRGRLKPDFANKLAPLEVDKGINQAFLHIRYVFGPSVTQTLEPVTLTVSTPLADTTPLHEVDLNHQAELVTKLGQLLKLPLPNRSDVSVDVDIKRHPFADLQVGDRWQEIHGAKDWEGLLDHTMDPLLRGELIRYGEFAQATYDAFNNDQESKACGNSKFGMDDLLDEVGLHNRGYEIAEYLYATADAHLPKFFKRSGREDKWSKDSNFMGFVAVCTSPREIARLGRRDIVVAWRGTVTQLEWIENMRDFFSPTGLDPRGNSDVMVESGFLSVYKSKNENSRYNKLSAREQVLTAVKNLVQQYKNEQLSITVTGHSLGSALSMLCAYDIAESGINKLMHSPKVPQHWEEPELDATCKASDHPTEPRENRVPVTVFSFAGPRLGNSDFKTRVEELGVKVLRVVNVHDVVPKVPGIIFNEALEFVHNISRLLPDSYNHVGTELQLDSRSSHYLRDTTDPINAHNLEAYLHLLDGYHGPNARFSPAVKRDIALVNKASDFLKGKFGIPPFWWDDGKMVKDKESGQWVCP